MPVFGISLLICLLNLLNAQLQTLSMFQHLLYVLDKREIKLQCVPLEKKGVVFLISFSVRLYFPYRKAIDLR